MLEYAPQYEELASRDVVSRAEQTEINEGRGIEGNVLLDLRHLGREFIEDRLGYLQEVAVEFLGVDLAEQPVPVRPGVHYIMGGVKTDVDGATVVPGLYAAGECANVSVHGANRLGANSLLDTVVFGRRSAVHAAEYVKSVSDGSGSEEHVEATRNRIREIFDREPNENWASVRNFMANEMTKGIGVFRDQASMEGAKAAIQDVNRRVPKMSVQHKGKVFNTDLIFTLEMEFMADVGTAIVHSALARKESRGAHFRTDITDARRRQLAQTHARISPSKQRRRCPH